jgi:hypothetical protein
METVPTARVVSVRKRPRHQRSVLRSDGFELRREISIATSRKLDADLCEERILISL